MKPIKNGLASGNRGRAPEPTQNLLQGRHCVRNQGSPLSFHAQPVFKMCQRPRKFIVIPSWSCIWNVSKSKEVHCHTKLKLYSKCVKNQGSPLSYPAEAVFKMCQRPRKSIVIPCWSCIQDVSKNREVHCHTMLKLYLKCVKNQGSILSYHAQAVFKMCQRPRKSIVIPCWSCIQNVSKTRKVHCHTMLKLYLKCVKIQGSSLSYHAEAVFKMCQRPGKSIVIPC